jgi:hypothetical protein
MWTCRKRAAGVVKSPNGVTVGRFWRPGRTGKHVSRCCNPSARLATQNTVHPASRLLWCLCATDHGWTGTLGAVGELEHTSELSRQTRRSRWGTCYSGLVVSRSQGVVDPRSVRSSSSPSCGAASAS